MQTRSEQDQSEAVAFLRSGAAFDAAGPVKTVETHGALVFLAGETALKIKRAVRYDYMDLSTLALREKMLRRELSLNAPGAPMIYRDVVPLTRGADGQMALGGAGTPVEWVLRMWRFPGSAELVKVAARGDLDHPLADRLGREIEAWHARCEVRRVGGARLIREILDELDRVFANMADPLGAERIGRFHTLSRAALDDASHLLNDRAEAGHVRRAHGDLHLGNIVLLDGAPVLFDALEFDETLGTCDVLYDLAFLLMDLTHRGLAAQACTVLTSYLLAARGAEDAGVGALPLFQAVRAAIRAMTTVQTDRARGTPDSGAARAYLDRALANLTPPPPALVAVGGLSGTGKTALARAIAPCLGPGPGAVHLRSDTERKALAGVASDASLDAVHYTDTARERIYRHMAARAAALLSAGQAVVLDATFLEAADRAAAESVAAGAGLPFTGLWLEAQEDALLARVTARRADASDADADVVRKQIAAAPAPPLGWRRIDASGTPDQTLRRARAALGASAGALARP